MVYCDACALKKPVPADRVVQMGPCSCGTYENCPIFVEAVARMKAASERAPIPSSPGGGGRKETS